MENKKFTFGFNSQLKLKTPKKNKIQREKVKRIRFFFFCKEATKGSMKEIDMKNETI